MKAIDKQWNAAGRPGSIEIKLSSPLRLNVWLTVAMLALLAGGSAFYVWVWSQLTAYQWGHYWGSFGSPAGLGRLVGVLAVYLVLDYLILYLLTGGDRRAIRWRADWVGIGPHCLYPIRLRHYRWLLLTPCLLLGLAPAACGLLTGQTEYFQWGLWGLAVSLLDISMLWRLRYYPGSDYYLEGTKTYEGRIIVRGL